MCDAGLLSLAVSFTKCRFSEFGRAAVNMNLRGDGPTVHYFGLIQQEYKTNLTAVKSMVYKKWDEDTNLSPPKTRPLRESSAAAAAVPSLDILAWANDRPVFPAVLLTKFPEGTAEHARMLELKKDFDEKYPEASQPPPAVGSGRAGGVCDYSVDGGRHPLDCTRVIDLPLVGADSSGETRLRGVAFVSIH